VIWVTGVAAVSSNQQSNISEEFILAPTGVLFDAGRFSASRLSGTVLSPPDAD